MLELAEGLARLVGLVGCFHGFKGPHALDEHKRPPVFPVAAAEIAFPILRRNDGEAAPHHVADATLAEFAAEVRGYAVKIVHDARGILEHLMIDALMDVADWRSALIVSGGVRFIDVANLAGLSVQEFPVDVKLARDL